MNTAPPRSRAVSNEPAAGSVDKADGAAKFHYARLEVCE